jgi:hypothetical protein
MDSPTTSFLGGDRKFPFKAFRDSGVFDEQGALTQMAK